MEWSMEWEWVLGYHVKWVTLTATSLMSSLYTLKLTRSSAQMEGKDSTQPTQYLPRTLASASAPYSHLTFTPILSPTSLTHTSHTHILTPPLTLPSHSQVQTFRQVPPDVLRRVHGLA